VKARRKRSDPQATRYRIAVAALAKAEKRKAAAEKAIKELRAKVRGYERRLPPERRAEIEAGTDAAKAKAAELKGRWKSAERTLLTAARMGSQTENPVVYSYKPSNRRTGLYVYLPENRVLVWHHTRGYLSGRKGPHTGMPLDLQPIDDKRLSYLETMEEAA
jgi:hypothetical protein